MKYLTFIFLILITSCIKEMTNEEIIKEVKKCKEAGMNYGQYENYDGTTRLIKCKQ